MSKPFLFVACTHGDEPIGKDALEALKMDAVVRDSFDLVIGNPKAFSLKRRFVDADLNRSAPGKLFSTAYEVRRARTILKKARSYPFVIDLHQTFANDRIVVIVTRVTPANLALALQFPIDTILLWPSSDTTARSGPIVSCVRAGIEIESGTKTSVAATREKLTAILRDFFAANRAPVPESFVLDPTALASRHVYLVGDTIERKDLTNGPLVDFQPYRNGSGTFCPLLFGRHAGLLGYKMWSVHATYQNDKIHLRPRRDAVPV